MTYAFNPSTRETKAQGQPSLHSESQDSQGYVERSYLKTKTKQNRPGLGCGSVVAPMASIHKPLSR
jgi:hypothetical protein